MPAPLTSTAQHNQQPQRPRTMPTKSVKHKSSKPIINWLQRKLGGTVRARRASDPTLPINVPGARATYNGRTATKQVRTTAARETDENSYAMRSGNRPFSNEISLNSTEDYYDELDGDRRSSGVAVSMWGSRSNPLEADEDASIRPLPPTSPPSPSPSRSSSSYMSNSRTFQSITASTKPTTVLSIDLNPSGVAHIAQAPSTPTSVSASFNAPGPSPIARFQPHVRSGSNVPGGVGSVTFFALPSSTPPSSRPSSLGTAGRITAGALQAPAHTAHHPRNNPRPSSPPLDNASMLTLASSAFATPLAERARGAVHAPYSWTAGADSVSQVSHGGLAGDSVSQIILDGELADEQNASIRALRPRSARRDSWESEMSRWSAGASILGALGGHDRSIRTAPSFRTGGQYTIDADDAASMNNVDEDVGSTREEGGDEGDTEKDGLRGDEERALSPLSALSIEEVSEEQSTHETSNEAESQDSQSHSDFDDLATPGPEGRTLVLSPSSETVEPVPSLTEKRPVTPPTSVPGKETELTPKKEKHLVV